MNARKVSEGISQNRPRFCGTAAMAAAAAQPGVFGSAEGRA